MLQLQFSSPADGDPLQACGSNDQQARISGAALQEHTLSICCDAVFLQHSTNLNNERGVNNRP
jgi:hypothetical protein